MILVSTAEAALALGVREHSIRNLAARGRLTRYGYRNRREYDLAEVLAIHDRWAALAGAHTA